VQAVTVNLASIATGSSHRQESAEDNVTDAAFRLDGSHQECLLLANAKGHRAAMVIIDPCESAGTNSTTAGVGG